MNLKISRKCVSFLMAILILTGCASNPNKVTEKAAVTQSLDTDFAKQVVEGIEYEVDPETFELAVKKGDISVPVSQPFQKRRIGELSNEGTETRWVYPEENISVSIQTKEDYLHVTMKSETKADNSFQWPSISGEIYYMPFGEGKRIPATDKAWSNYLDGNVFNTLEQLSMPFWAVSEGDYAVLFIMENPYRNEMSFSADPAIHFTLTHQYPEIDGIKENSFRIYLIKNNPAAASKVYRQYVKDTGDFVTLEEKAAENPNIRKLYGAPQIYLWGDNLITPENINWPAFRQLEDGSIIQYLKQFADKTETGKEATQAFTDIAGQDYVSQYQKNTICRFLSGILKRSDFYEPQIFTKQNEKMNIFLEKGIKNLKASDIMQLNKCALAVNLPEVFSPEEEWMNSETMELIKELKNSGIEQAWIGLNSWEQAYAKPELVQTAVEQGYLIAPYDSYHSIHEPGNEQWTTAKFADTSLYEEASVSDKNGEKLKGFQDVGRKLNPTLSLPSVKQRINGIFSTKIPFNSWFIDCDATGEIYDDYTRSHVTTQQEDLKARLERMAYIKDNYSMVIGSEGGNDFAASTIAFAHGIELKTFSWMDKDMKQNKESEYYIGNYYNPAGGVAEHFAKTVPIKEQYYPIFVDPKYDIPLFKLVYNDSVITSYHWDWSTFKIADSVQERMLREILYNVPPLYHLDRNEWEMHKEDISSHTKVWSQFSKKAVTKEMTDFKFLKEDGSVQMTEYGDEISVIANFGDVPYSYTEHTIPEHSLLLQMDGRFSIYTPVLSE
jgi:hypothetical protein